MFLEILLIKLKLFNFDQVAVYFFWPGRREELYSFALHYRYVWLLEEAKTVKKKKYFLRSWPCMGICTAAIKLLLVFGIWLKQVHLAWEYCIFLKSAVEYGCWGTHRQLNGLTVTWRNGQKKFCCLKMSWYCRTLHFSTTI